jgi:hypothetical protein
MNRFVETFAWVQSPYFIQKVGTISSLIELSLHLYAPLHSCCLIR